VIAMAEMVNTVFPLSSNEWASGTRKQGVIRAKG
jgi:hypothetical protein